jgi:ABC-type sugar transport system substrate-binding protein
MAEQFPDITVLPVEMEGFDPSAAQAKAVAILQANPEVTAAFGTTGNSIQTWAGAAEAAGRDDLVIIGMDYIRQNLDLVRDARPMASSPSRSTRRALKVPSCWASSRRDRRSSTAT